MVKVMNFQAIQSGNIRVISVLKENFNNTIAAEFRDMITKFIEQGDTNFIIDLSHVNYMDSSGLGAIITVNNLLTKTLKETNGQGKIVISNVQPTVKAILAVFHIEIIMTVFETREEAIKAF
jgi:anti-sigma B factor antagonist